MKQPVVLTTDRPAVRGDVSEGTGGTARPQLRRKERRTRGGDSPGSSRSGARYMTPGGYGRRLVWAVGSLSQLAPVEWRDRMQL